MPRPAHFVGPCDLDARLAQMPARPGDGTVVLVESVAKGRALPWHRKKLVLVLSAMRHFAESLRAAGHHVEIVNAPTYAEGIRRHVEAHGSSEIHLLRQRDLGIQRGLEVADLGAPAVWHDDGGEGGHFLLTRAEAVGWVEDQGKTLRMDRFHRWMRERTGWLVESDGRPVGGKWSFDSENRKPPRSGLVTPEVPDHAPDDLTREVMGRVAGWPDHWGDVDGFAWPVTREGALEELAHFVAVRLPTFGDLQDAMVPGEDWMWHARLSAAMNLGLLHPREVCEAALEAFEAGEAPLNAVEGFVRQVMGWREFMRAVYLARMPALRNANLLGADRPLPALYWDPTKTRMRCLQESVRPVLEHGYAHHIQRLMILGNFALLVGVRPLDISHWFWAGFVDAHEWVELPNVHGMAVYADDSFTTKPYAASGNYVNKMSTYCKGCAYDVRTKHGEGACPFNPLFWHFMVRHRERLQRNVRLARLYATWDRKSADDRAATLDSAEAFLEALESADTGWTFHDDQG